MQVNLEVILLASISIAIILLVAVGFATGLFTGGRKETRNKLDKLKSRFKDDLSSNASAKASIRKKQEESGIADIVSGLIPRPEELQMRIERSGLGISLARYASIVGGLTFGLILFFLIIGTAPFLAITGGLALGLGLPSFYIKRRMQSRIAAFTKQFPEAIDLMVRGLKSGLPVNECISSISQEISAPTGTEFKKITDQIKLGTSLEDALWDTANRLDTPDFKFFVISLSVQRETGGNLGETLANLSHILRQRQGMKLKVKALSSEAKASAWIVGLLPFIMLGMITSINPEYGMVLFTNPKATFALVVGFAWMGIGIFIMSRLTSFEV